MDDLRYPIRRFNREVEHSPEARAAWIAELRDAPQLLQAAVAGLDEARTGPVALPLPILVPLHRRWTVFLESLTAAEFARAFSHKEHGHVDLSTALANYARDGGHHAAPITALGERNGW